MPRRMRTQTNMPKSYVNVFVFLNACNISASL
jgi:hypothetical protein